MKINKKLPGKLWLFAAVSGLALTLGACAGNRGPDEDLPAATITGWQQSGQVLPFSQLNAAVIARHPGCEVDHAALDKIGDRLLYQASVTDPNKMQWFVELDARNAMMVTDKQE
jgi:uncharacterized membrane protein YkoI